MSGAFAHKLPPREPTLGELLNEFEAYRDNWTPENDGKSLKLADELRVRIMADFGLSKSETEVLGSALL